MRLRATVKATAAREIACSRPDLTCFDQPFGSGAERWEGIGGLHGIRLSERGRYIITYESAWIWWFWDGDLKSVDQYSSQEKLKMDGVNHAASVSEARQVIALKCDRVFGHYAIRRGA